jgi:hypothetical protein
MFTDHVGVNGVRIDVKNMADDLFQACGIEHGAGAHDACGRQAGNLGHPLGEDVNRIADDDNCPASTGQAPADIADHGRVLTQ